MLSALTLLKGTAGAPASGADASLPLTTLLYFDHMWQLRATAAVVSVSTMTVTHEFQASMFSIPFQISRHVLKNFGDSGFHL